MGEPHLTVHAIQRYRERVEDVPPDEVIGRLDTPAMRTAIKFGANGVKLPTGHVAVLEGGHVVTVTPKHKGHWHGS